MTGPVKWIEYTHQRIDFVFFGLCQSKFSKEWKITDLLYFRLVPLSREAKTSAKNSIEMLLTPIKSRQSIICRQFQD